ncbi:LysR substrate-binding domain-containing protein [Saccharibacillus alkalitolerans]|uniref:LysR family transcriptional regulator n=1 Tax=Saccharibacillus alkalitolerans TaxID=2705290 RepID=A0ABX0F3W4_9BACL|nr:LysR substrate-binding domain-containing protein [Saccharibacillus alkalitolerans]NGZ74584.1 LysR family transcriptional regulator [Saccharibacillus alkalitolerans]
MNLNLTKLKIVELLEQHNKITTVAEMLDLKQPTVTFHMKNMEKDFGVKLFETKMGKIVLTDAGRALQHYAVKIGALAAEAERAVSEFDTLRKGRLRIGASYVPATYLLPGVLHRFSALYPGVQLSLSVKTAPAVKEMLEKHEIDLGFASTDSFESPELLAEPIGKDELVLIFAPSHRLASIAEPTADQIVSSYFVMHGMESSTRRLTENWLDAHSRRLPSYLEFDSLEAIKQTVMLGEHVSFVSRLAVREEIERGLLQMRPIPGGRLNRHIYMVTNRQRYRSALLGRFTDHLTKQIRTPNE